MGIREKQWDQWILIREIMKILKKAREKNNYMDSNLLFKEIGTSRNSNAINSMEERLVKSTINQLTQEPFKIIELSESGNIILAYPGSIVQKKINCLFRFFMSEKL